mgnify:CR=1 FL=1
MKFLFFNLWLFMAFFSTYSFAVPQMKSVEQILNAENTPATRLLVMQRCSALYLTAANISDTRNDAKHIAKELEDVANFFGILAIQFSKKDSNLRDLSVDGNADAILRMHSAYMDDAENARALSGNYTDGIMKTDLPACKALYDGAQSLTNN